MDEKRVFSMNTLRVCVDECSGTATGKVYSKLSPVPLEFSGLGEMLLDLDRMFDSCGYPQAFQERRSFCRRRERPARYSLPKPQMSDEEIDRQRGKYRTVDFVVQSRRHTGWQGLLMRPDRTVLMRFNSEMELLEGLSRELSEKSG